MDVPPIETERLELLPLPEAFIEALVERRREQAAELGLTLPEDWPDDHDARFLHFRLRQMRADEAWRQWLVRGIVLRADGRPMIGHIGFHGPPGVNAKRRPDAVEVGYTVFPAHRRQGYATEALRALIGWTHREHSIRHFIASVAPDNDPSLAIVRRLGFVETGSHWDDDDGLELEWELDLSAG
ncbi:MAG: GNAT family N-acetyltransferase [Thermoleophilia bacterium]|nr:GNAT family N-acetyltransferase [Thermoleophilia bacterium]